MSNKGTATIKNNKKVLYDFNDKEKIYNTGIRIEEWFEKQVEKTPDNIAVVDASRPGQPGDNLLYLTYRQLNEKADILAGMLKGKGVGRGTITGIMVERSVEMILAILAILKTGAVYLPLNPKNPPARSKLMLDDCSVEILLTQDKFAAKAGQLGKRQVIELQAYTSGGCAERPAGRGTDAPAGKVTGKGGAADPAYVIYTSGSTGIPKGVLVTHGNFSQLLHWGLEHLKPGPCERALQNLSFYFDWSVWEIFLILSSGGSLYMTGEEILFNPPECMDFMDKHGITVLHITPTQYGFFLAEGRRIESLKYLCIGAEKMSLDMAGRSLESVGSRCRVFNMYGPTEATIISAVLDVDACDTKEYEHLSGMPIGGPASNNVFLVLGEDMSPRGVNDEGELYIGGDGLALGYVNNPGLTADKFIPAPASLADIAPGRLYRTGDLTRWLPDGTVEFLGRVDHQVKIRGFRIELGEIEKQLLENRGVCETVVVAGEDDDGGKYLCAYFIADEELDITELRENLALRLPDYMVPSYFVELDKFPLSPNGKIDLSALPKPGIDKRKDYAAPGTKTEKALVKLWAEVLGVDAGMIGIDTGFFEFGGHSLKATLLVSKLHKTFDVKISLDDVFRKPTVRGLAALLGKAGRDAHNPIEPAEEKEYYALSSAQKRIYVSRQLDSRSTSYNIPAAYTITGKVDEKKLARTFEQLVTRYESFRTSFHVVGNETVQKVHRAWEFEIEHLEVGDAPFKQVIKDFVRPFDLSAAPLLRAGLFEPDQGSALLIVDMHHIISDGISLDIFQEELCKLYDGIDLSPQRIQYKDYSEWLRSATSQQELQKQEEYWLNEFSGDRPVLDLPADFKRPLTRSFEGDVLYLDSSGEEIARLGQLARKNNTTLYMVLLSIYSVLLGKLCNSEDIVLGTVASGRRHADVEPLIGMFVNTLALRNFPAADNSFISFLRQVNERTLSAFENQEYQFDDLVDKVARKRQANRNPLFDVVFALENFLNLYSGEGADDLRLQPYPYKDDTAIFDMILTAIEGKHSLRFRLEYCTKLYKKETAETFAGYFRRVMAAVLEDPAGKLADIEILSPQEKERVLYGFNRREKDYTRDMTIHGLFEEQAKKNPGHIALVESLAEPGDRAVQVHERTLTYEELDRESSGLAALLREKGVAAGVIVGIMADRSSEMIKGILGILKAGGAYLPLNPKNPAERNRFMLADCRCFVLLARGKFIAGMKDVWDKEIIDLGGGPFAGCCGEAAPVHAADPAYVIYTSGSTGIPKGVIIGHSNFSPLVHWGFQHLGLTEDDRALQNLAYYFDWSVWEIFLVLGSGARLYITSEDVLLDARLCIEFIREKRITVLHITPTQYGYLLNEGQKLETLTRLCIGAEKMSVAMARRSLESVNPGCRVYNMYGPTEATIIAAVLDVDSYDMNRYDMLLSMPIGCTVGNNGLLILDKRFNPVPVMVAGELVIAGEGVSRGYLNNPELTAEKFASGSKEGFFEKSPPKQGRTQCVHPNFTPYFVQNSPQKTFINKKFCSNFFNPAVRGTDKGFGLEVPSNGQLANFQLIYRTGDLARWLPDGTVEFLGRRDAQVKIRGFRIELGEIETQLLSHDQVAEAVVITGEKEADNPYICAYVVCDEGLEMSSLREFLSGKLPGYMIPAYFVRLEKIPLDPNGKADINALPRPDREQGVSGAEYAAPRSAVEEQLAAIWCEVLGLERVGIYDDFFLLGGHSLPATQVVSRICEAFNVEFPLQGLFEYPTISSLSVGVEKMTGMERQPESPRIEKVSRESELPLSFAQQRLWFLDRYETGTALYNIPVALRLSGPLDIESVELSLTEIIRRHESLRTAFLSKDGRPFQEIAADMKFSLDVINIEKPGAKEKEADALRILKQESIKPFDLAKPPLFRFLLLRLDPRRFILFFNMHHIIADGWSVDVLFREFGILYRSFSSGDTSPLCDLPIQYADFAVWQRNWLSGAVLDRQLTYWKEQLAGVPVLELPTDFTRPKSQTFRGGLKSFSFTGALSQKLSALSRETGATLFMVLLAVFKVLLYRYTGQEDIAVGSPIANRSRREIEDLIGFFVNTLVMRTDMSGEPTFKELISRLRDMALAAYSHQDVPFEMLVDELSPGRDLSHTPLFQVLFSLHGAGTELPDLPEVENEYFEVFTGTSKFDLSLFLSETAAGLKGEVEYNADLFKPGTIERLVGHFEMLSEQAASGPDRCICDVSILSEQEKHRLLVQWNDRTAEFSRDRCIHELFERQVEQTPDRVALVWADCFVTYDGLNRRANRLSHYLRLPAGETGCPGVGPEIPVGIFMDRSPGLAAGLLGVLKAGGAYVPLDPAYPKERLSYILEQSGARTLLTERHLLDRLSFFRGKRVILDSDWQAFAEYEEENGEPVGSSANLAYIIYTSGSTGVPKGVAIQHTSTIALISWAVDYFAEEELAGVLASTSICFDLSVFEMFVPLSMGGTIFLVDSILDLPSLKPSGGVSLVNTVPSAMREMLALGGLPASCRVVNLAGEPLKKELVNSIYELGTVAKVYDLYGPSEDTTYSTVSLRVPDGIETIGVPINNTRVYILDNHLNPVPVGVPGELYIGGCGLARGYYGRPDLTAERFIPDPFAAGRAAPAAHDVAKRDSSQEKSSQKNKILAHSTTGDGRLYRTGDLARYLADGNIEFLGRLDYQVKVRGFRIELGEIESVLSRHPGIAEAAALAREDMPGSKQLVAYVVAAEESGELSVSELRGFLQERLPAYMVPSAFVEIDALPLTPNGKVDRKALPKPARDSLTGGDEFTAPRTPVEEKIAGIWSAVLGVDRVGVYDNFFELGGHSLIATRVSSRMSRLLNREFPLQWIFEYPTISSQAAKLSGAIDIPEQSEIVPLEKASRDGLLPLSFAQQRLWFLDRYEAGTSVYNIPVALRLAGPLDIRNVELSLTEIIRRHESLRTLFLSRDGQPFQEITADIDFSLAVIHIETPGEKERETKASRILKNESMKPFDLSTPPLFRFLLLRLAPQRFILFFNMHHIISDGWSVEVLFREFSLLYRSFSTGEPAALPALPIQYADFAIWQRNWLSGAVLDEQLAYWQAQLADVPVLELPTDFTRPKSQAFRGGVETFDIPIAISRQLTALSRETGATLFMVLLTAFKVLLLRCTGREDIAVGSPIANRSRREVEDLIGFFVNTLVLRTDLSGNPAFNELLSRVRAVSLAAYAHQDIPFEMLVEELSPGRDLSYTPLFQVLFTLQGAAEKAVTIPGAECEYFEVFTGTSKFDFSLFLTETDAGLKGEVEYNVDLFKRETITRLIGYFKMLLDRAASGPEQRICDICILSDLEKQKLLVEWNDTAANYPAEKTIRELFEEQVEIAPDSLALVHENRQFSYRELNEKANRLAEILIDKGVAANRIVGIMEERSTDMIVGLLGILKAGGAYLPLDIDYPDRRIGHILKDSAAGLLLTRFHLTDRIEFNGSVIDIREKDLDCGNCSNPAQPYHSGSLAYVIYTSGTTGRPKGILVDNRSVVRLTKNTDFIRFNRKDRLLMTGALAFDASTFEIWGSLLNGLTLYLVNKDTILSPENLKDALSRYGINILWMTAALFNRMCDADVGIFAPLGHLLVGGDVLSPPHINRVRKTFPGLHIANGYGPTENTTFSTTFSIDREYGRNIPIGRPIANSTAYVLDTYMNAAPIGVMGELYVGGHGVARGYLNNPELTAEKFVTECRIRDSEFRMDSASSGALRTEETQHLASHVFPSHGGEAAGRGGLVSAHNYRYVYRTGDNVRRLPDGNIEFSGRFDHQVKVRGFRIELGEIEAVTKEYPAVAEALVLAREDIPGEKELVAYVVPSSETEALPIGELRDFLHNRLPDHMIPSAFVEMEALPLTSNGKIDRQALPRPEKTRSGMTGAYVAPRNSIEEKLAVIWQANIGIEQVGVNDNFFKLGGHSLLAIRVMSDIAKTFGLNLPLKTLFESPNIADLAVSIAKSKGSGSGAGEKPVALPAITPNAQDRFTPFPLTDIQEAYWVGRSGALELGNVSSHVYSEVDYKGLDLKRYEQAWRKLIDRHDMLRMIIRPDGMQQVLEEVPPFRVKTYDYRGKPEEDVSNHLMKIREEMAHQVLPTDRWPIFDIRATLLGGGLTRIHSSNDALTSDAWSWVVIDRELPRFYDEPDTSLPPLQLSFRDYVLAEAAFRESGIYRRSLDYWLDRLNTLPPAPELPLATEPAALTTPTFERHDSQLDAQAWGRIKTLASKAGLTPSIVLLSAFADVLALWSKNPRFSINLTLFNRLPFHPEVNDVVGDFTTLTLLQVDRTAVAAFEERVRRVQNRLWEDLDHRCVSGVRVLREMARMQGGAPRALMPVVFTSALVHGTSADKHKTEPGRDTSMFESLPAEQVYCISQTPQVWIDQHVYEEEGRLYFDWDSVEGLFPKGMIDDMFAVYCDLLHRVANDESAWQEKTWPTIPQTQIDLRKQVNDTKGPVSEELLHTLFIQQAQKTPDLPAVIYPGGSLTYNDLYLLANRVGRCLQQKGAQRNRLVGVLMDKGWEQVPAVLGILNSGAAYLPIDPNLPAERIHYLMEFGQLEIAVTQPWLDERLDWPENISRLVIGGSRLEEFEDSPLPVETAVTDLAYVIFTSGSTGLPKGVMIDHRGAVNTILDINRRFAVTAEDRVLALSALNFDLSVYDIFGLLAAGGAVVMPEADRGRDPSHWLASIKQEQVTLWDTVPALMEILVEYTEANSQQFPASLRQVFMSGDWIPVTLPDRIRALGKDIKVTSGGGATEASIWSISYPIGDVNPAWPSIPYGQPLTNQTFFVLDPQLEHRPYLVPGELYIGGIGVALGYWRDEEKTENSFIAHPRTGERLYRTGDMGLYLPDGNIQFLGREDLQVKVRGYRIELGEIEAALLQHPQVASGVVSVIGDTAGEKRLVAYVVPGAGASTANETAAFHDYQPPRTEGVVEDPLERIKFKMSHPGLRKVKEEDKTIRLSKPRSDDSLIETYLSRRSYRKFKAAPLSLEQLSLLLSCLAQVKLAGVPLPKYRYASAGSLYPVQVYLYVKPGRVDGLPGGSYYYDPQEHRLALLSEEAVIDPGLYPMGNKEIFEQAAFAIYLLGRMKGILPMYGQWSRDFCMLEAGLMSQLLEMSASRHRIGLCQVGGFDFDRIRSRFLLDDDHLYLHGLIGGGIEESQTRLQALVEDSGELSAMLEIVAKEPESPADSAVPDPPAASSPGTGFTSLLQQFLREKIPEYMVPTAFVFLDELPLTANGKIDRKSLPEPDAVEAAADTPYMAPETELEQTIAHVWQEILNVEKVGVHDNIFDLGGSSFHIVQIHNKLTEQLKKDISLVKLFEYPTISKLTHYLNEGSDDTTNLEESESRSELRRKRRRKRR